MHCDVTPVPGSFPLGRWAADEPPRRRVTEPTSRRARERQENEPTSPAPGPMAIPDAPRECGVPTPPCSAFRLLSSPAHSQRLAICSGQSHPGLQTQPPPARQQLKSQRLRAIRRPDRCGRVRAVRNSPSDVAACHRVVRRHTCSLVTRRSTRATQARAGPGAHVGRPAQTLRQKRAMRPATRPKSAWATLQWSQGSSAVAREGNGARSQKVMSGGPGRSQHKEQE